MVLAGPGGRGVGLRMGDCSQKEGKSESRGGPRRLTESKEEGSSHYCQIIGVWGLRRGHGERGCRAGVRI